MIALSALLRYWREAVVAACLIAMAIFAHHERAIGAAGERSAAADSTLRVVTPAKVRAETLVVRDVDTVTRLLAKLRTDTLWRAETVYVAGDPTPRVPIPLAVLHATDTTLTACGVLAHDCADFRVKADAMIAALNAKVAAQSAAPRPSRLLWFTVGAAAGRASCYGAPPHPFP